tara:strand:- start:703 stop:1086 length:384 start_codon:yes stop_codon:yes gene_type:complete
MKINSTMNNNKLIAEFMGLRDGDKYLSPTLEDAESVGLGMHVYSDEMRYHISWDWLMPVVEKIEEIAINDDNLTIKEHRYQFDMGYTQCNIYDHVKDCVVASGDMGSKLLSTHQAVVEFINEHKKKA